MTQAVGDHKEVSRLILSIDDPPVLMLGPAGQAPSILNLPRSGVFSTLIITGDWIEDMRKFTEGEARFLAKEPLVLTTKFKGILVANESISMAEAELPLNAPYAVQVRFYYGQKDDMPDLVIRLTPVSTLTPACRMIAAQNTGK